MKRRHFLRLSTGAAGLTLIDASGPPPLAAAGQEETPISRLRPMTQGIVPISDGERLARMEKARRLMAENKIDALCLEGGSNLYYFTGVDWWPSERVFVLILPARGEMVWISPKFEEDRARELIRFGKEIRTWEEDENPYKVIAAACRDLGIGSGRIGIDEHARFFIFDGLRREAPGMEYACADPVTVGCRVIKSSAELALMQRANDITIAAYKATLAMIKEGMSDQEFLNNSVAAFSALGVYGGIGASFGESSSYPHGSIKPKKLRAGDIVLMDGGCDVEKYCADISRTIVFGKPSQRQRDIWNLEKEAQQAAFHAARPGVTCEEVDAAARNVITKAGFGPGYKVPGLPHRTGHGIGLEGHEAIYLVRGNKTPMQPGMCFTNEPTIIIPGEFGVRLEDDMVITQDGAKYFTLPSPSIEQPFAGMG
jgi:Xaa-Pro dipeptidase